MLPLTGARRSGFRQLTPDSIADAWLVDRLTHDPFRGAAHPGGRWERTSANTTRCPGAMPFCACMRRLNRGAAVQRCGQPSLPAVASPGYLSITTPPFRRSPYVGCWPCTGLAFGDPDAGRRLRAAAEPDRTLIVHHRQRCEFDVFIDARGQKALKTRSALFPSPRQQLPPAATTFRTLVMTTRCRRRRQCGSGRLRRPSWLMHDRPFCAGADGQRRDWQRNGPRRVAAGRAGRRRRLWYIE